MEKVGFIVAGVEMLSRMITRYAIFENLYLDRANQGSKELKIGLTSLYASILSYLSKAKRFIEDSPLSKYRYKASVNLYAYRYLSGRVAKSLPDSGEEFIRLSEEVTAAQSLVDQCADLVRMENSNAVHNTLEALSVDERDRFEKLKLLLKDIDEPIQRMTNQLKNVEDHLDSMFKAYRLKIVFWNRAC